MAADSNAAVRSSSGAKGQITASIKIPGTPAGDGQIHLFLDTLAASTAMASQMLLVAVLGRPAAPEPPRAAPQNGLASVAAAASAE